MPSIVFFFFKVIPTVGFSVETFTSNNMSFTAVDMSGQSNVFWTVVFFFCNIEESYETNLHGTLEEKLRNEYFYLTAKKKVTSKFNS